MTWKLALVPTEEVKALWPTVGPLLARAIPYASGRFSLRDVFESLLEARQLLWVAYDDADKKIVAALTTRTAKYARRSALVVECCGGARLKDWMQVATETFQNYARDAGLEPIEMYGRPGWARALKPAGWRQKLVVLEISSAAAVGDI